MKLLILFLTVLMQAAAFAQVSTSISVRPPAETGYGSVQYNNPSALGQKSEVKISDEEISGSVFWKNDWNKSYIYLTSGGVVKLNRSKFNLQNNELYFFDSNNTIKAADESLINKIMFIDKKDSTQTLAVFQKLHYDGNDFFQVFNGGVYQLLKAVKITVTKRDYNVLLGKDEYAYEVKPVYYLFHEGQISKVDVLNKEHFDMYIHLKVDDTLWLTQNKNRLKGETDWVNFLNYYNSR